MQKQIQSFVLSISFCLVAAACTANKSFNSIQSSSGQPSPQPQPGTNIPPATQPPSPLASVRVAFVGDTGAGPEFQDVLNLIKSRNVELVLVGGDTDYGDGEAKWDNMVKNTLGNEAALIAMGNHDYEDSDPALIIQLGLARLAKVPYLKCEGEYGEKFTCLFRGLYIVISGIGSDSRPDSEHEQYIKTQLENATPGFWRICSWHKNQRLMQVGGKGDEVGWTAYETCRQHGALITTGHEHSYSRTHLLSNMQNQTIAATGSPLTVREGATIAWVSGLGGQSIRDQSLSGDYWASVYTSNQGAKDGVLFGTFRGNQADFEFINIDNQVIDRFTVLKGY